MMTIFNVRDDLTDEVIEKLEDAGFTVKESEHGNIHIVTDDDG